MANIVFIGAGSAGFGMSMFRDLFTTPELKGSSLVLMNKDPDARIPVNWRADNVRSQARIISGYGRRTV